MAVCLGCKAARSLCLLHKRLVSSLTLNVIVSGTCRVVPQVALVLCSLMPSRRCVLLADDLQGGVADDGGALQVDWWNRRKGKSRQPDWGRAARARRHALAGRGGNDHLVGG